jgi:hypothetical protein
MGAEMKSSDMAKIGDMDYPADMLPEEAREAVEILVNEFGGEAGSEEAFAQSIGHSSTNSGTYLRKRADMRKYGLMKPRSIEATEFGIEAANPKDEKHKQEILYRMLQNIPLLSKVGDATNGTTPPELWRILNDITDADPKEAQESEDLIETLYSKMLEYETDENSADSDNQGQQSQMDRTGEENSTSGEPGQQVLNRPESGIFVKVGNDQIRLENLTDSNIDLAIQFLKSKKGSGTESVQMRFG